MFLQPIDDKSGQHHRYAQMPAAGRAMVTGIRVVPTEPGPVTIGPVVKIELERVQALELLGMTLAHLQSAEARAELLQRVPLLIGIRDKLALALREEP